MLTLKQIKENTEAVIERLRKKQFEAREAITEVLNFDEIRRRSQQELDASLSRQKALAKEIGDLMKQGAKEQAESIRSQVALLKEASKSLEEKKAEAEAKIREILLSVPNLPADIVPEGRKWGFQVATEQSNNAVKPQYDFTRWLGWDDYRTLPIGATADGDNVLGGVGTNTPQTLIFDQGSFEDPRRKNNRFGGDRYWQGAAAFKTDIADGLAAYSYRSKGNYYAGKAGAGGYRNNPIYAYSRCYETGGTDEECLSTATLVPNMAKMFPEGREVYNTNTETKTLLLKNNWHLPGSQPSRRPAATSSAGNICAATSVSAKSTPSKPPTK